MFKRAKDQKGFTLIELMIVIAIIGILAAIAIPNFIAYRDKSYCSATESDANFIAGAVADYFAIPTNVSISKEALEGTNDSNKVYVRTNLSNQNTWDLDGDAVEEITITVTDATGRCPEDYRTAMTAENNPTGYWTEDNEYIKLMQSK